jgi:hypothetical protein
MGGASSFSFISVSYSTMPSRSPVLLGCFAAILLACIADAQIQLQINVRYNGKQTPSSLYLRGNNLGLNWNKGIQMTFAGNYTWTAALSYNSSLAGQVLQVKPLVADSTWSIGANFQILLPPQASQATLFPWFYSKAGQYKGESPAAAPRGRARLFLTFPFYLNLK